MLNFLKIHTKIFNLFFLLLFIILPRFIYIYRRNATLIAYVTNWWLMKGKGQWQADLLNPSRKVCVNLSLKLMWNQWRRQFFENYLTLLLECETVHLILYNLSRFVVTIQYTIYMYYVPSPTSKINKYQTIDILDTKYEPSWWS